MNQLHPSVKTIWLIQYAIWTTVSALGVFIYDVTGLFAGERVFPFGLLTIGVAAIGASACVMLPRLRYRFWRYALNEDELHLKRGVLTRVHTIVPLRRIQHLDVSQNVLEREFDLARLIIHTAGTQGNSVVLPGLKHEVASSLRDELKQYVLEDIS